MIGSCEAGISFCHAGSDCDLCGAVSGRVFLEEAPEEIQERKSGANEHLENGEQMQSASQRQYTAREMMRTRTYYWLSLAMHLRACVCAG